MPYPNNYNYGGYPPAQPQYDPNFDYYLELMQKAKSMEQRFPHFAQAFQPQPQMQPAQQATYVTATPPTSGIAETQVDQVVATVVSSEEEVRKHMPDISGAIQIFVQKEGGKITRFFTQCIDSETFDPVRAIYEKTSSNEDLPAAVVTAEQESAVSDAVKRLNTAMVDNLVKLYNTLDGVLVSLDTIKEELHNDKSKSGGTSDAERPKTGKK